MAQVQKQLGDVLLERGLVTAEQLSFATQQEQRTGESAWKILMERGVLTEKDLVRARAAQIGMEFIDVRAAAPSRDALMLVPQEVAQRQLILPIRVDGEELVIAMAEPTNHLAVEEISRLTGKRVTPAAGYRPDLLEITVSAYQNDSSSEPPPGPADPPTDRTSTATFGPEDLPMVEAQPAEIPAVEIQEPVEKEPNLADFLMAVIEKEASDLHITGGLPPMVRVHGELEALPGYRRLLPKDLQEIIYSMLTQKQREVFEENLELDISYQLPGKARFRVNVFQQRDALGAVMRRIPFEIKTLDELGLPSSVKEFASLRRGLVLVTGITGSGKSTTLAGLIDIVNSTRAEHIMTVEDPIEFLHKHKKAIVNQREIGADTHGFGNALKHVLRQDPDVILVGEMRDLETISAALTAAETGHLVFGTLHTQDAPQSVDRVIDVFPPHQQQQIRVQLAGTLAGVVSQQLLPTPDKKGRVVAAEVLVATPAVRNLIREGKTHQIYTSMQAGGKHGMQVMDQALAELVKKGKVTYEMGLERAHHVEEFNRLTGKG
jgi:twitching motility protein PilT